MQINTDKFLYPDITVKHLKLMIHAIGLDDERPKRSRYGEYYYPFRNYYNAGEVSNEWEELVKLGYAAKTGKATYCVTLGGLNALSNLIDVHIYSSAARYKATTLRKVFNFLCKASVFYGDTVGGTYRQFSKMLTEVYGNIDGNAEYADISDAKESVYNTFVR